MGKRTALPLAIRTIRIAKDLPAGKVATDALMSSAHLFNIESGHRNATPESIELLAKALDVHIDAISYVAPSEAVA